MKKNILLQNGSILKVQPIRQRKIYSCVACHTKKIKCSKTHPVCDRCTKLGLQCEYYVNDRISRRPARKLKDQENHAKEDDTKSERNKVVLEKPSVDRKPASTNKEKEIVEEQTMGDLRKKINKEPHRITKQKVQTITKKPASPISQQQEMIQEDMEKKILWSEIQHQNKQAIITGKSQYKPSQSTPANLSFGFLPLPNLPKCERTMLVELIISNLPTRSVSNQYFQIYASKIDYRVPKLDLPEFKTQYNLHCDTHSLKLESLDESLDYYLTYYIILYAVSHKVGNSAKLAKYHHVIQAIFKYLKFPQHSTNYSLKYLQLFATYQSFTPFTPYSDTQFLVQIAKLFKLDRDPIIFHKSSDMALIQFNRLLWWHIVYLDLRAAIFWNKLPMIELDKSDTSLPTEIGLHKNVLVRMVFCNSRFRYAILMNEILKSSTQGGNLNIVKDKVLELEVRCNGSIMSLNSYLSKSKKNNSQTSAHSRIYQDQQKEIELLIEEIKCLPDMALLLAYKRLQSPSQYLYKVSFPKYSDNLSTGLVSSSEEIYFNYNNYGISDGYGYVVLHLLNRLDKIDEKSTGRSNMLRYPVCPFWNLIASNFISPQFLIHIVGVLLFNILQDIGSFKQGNGANSMELAIDRLRNDVKLNILNKLLCPIMSNSPTIPQLDNICGLVIGVITLVKIYPLKIYQPREFVNSITNDGMGFFDGISSFEDLEKEIKPAFTTVEQYISHFSLDEVNSCTFPTFVDSYEDLSSEALSTGTDDKNSGVSSNFVGPSLKESNSSSPISITSPSTISSNSPNSFSSPTTSVSNISTANNGKPFVFSQGVSCSDIAPRSMTALVAASTIAKINVFGRSSISSYEPIFESVEPENDGATNEDKHNNNSVASIGYGKENMDSNAGKKEVNKPEPNVADELAIEKNVRPGGLSKSADLYNQLLAVSLDFPTDERGIIKGSGFRRLVQQMVETIENWRIKNSQVSGNNSTEQVKDEYLLGLEKGMCNMVYSFLLSI